MEGSDEDDPTVPERVAKLEDQAKLERHLSLTLSERVGRLEKIMCDFAARLTLLESKHAMEEDPGSPNIDMNEDDGKFCFNDPIVLQIIDRTLRTGFRALSGLGVDTQQAVTLLDDAMLCCTSRRVASLYASVKKFPRSGDLEVHVKSVSLVTRELLVFSITFEDPDVETLSDDHFEKKMKRAFNFDLSEHPELRSQSKLARSSAISAARNPARFNKRVRKYIVEGEHELESLKARYALFATAHFDCSINAPKRETRGGANKKKKHKNIMLLCRHFQILLLCSRQWKKKLPCRHLKTLLPCRHFQMLLLCNRQWKKKLPCMLPCRLKIMLAQMKQHLNFRHMQQNVLIISSYWMVWPSFCPRPEGDVVVCDHDLGACLTLKCAHFVLIYIIVVISMLVARVNSFRTILNTFEMC